MTLELLQSRAAQDGNAKDQHRECATASASCRASVKSDVVPKSEVVVLIVPPVPQISDMPYVVGDAATAVKPVCWSSDKVVALLSPSSIVDCP